MDFETRRITNSIRRYLSGLGHPDAIAAALLNVAIERLKNHHPNLATAIALLTHIQPHELELEVQRLQAMANQDEHFTGGDAA